MAEIKVTLKRINEKGRIAFEVPAEIEVQEALRNVLRTCRDKYNDYVSVTFKPPYKPRTTSGKPTRNHSKGGKRMSVKRQKIVLDRTQQRVFDFIQKNGSITTLQANKELGETRLSARIFELKEKGINICDEWIKVKNRFKEPRRVKSYFIGKAK